MKEIFLADDDNEDNFIHITLQILNSGSDFDFIDEVCWRRFYNFTTTMTLTHKYLITL